MKVNFGQVFSLKVDSPKEQERLSDMILSRKDEFSLITRHGGNEVICATGNEKQGYDALTKLLNPYYEEYYCYNSKAEPVEKAYYEQAIKIDLRHYPEKLDIKG